MYIKLIGKQLIYVHIFDGKAVLINVHQFDGLAGQLKYKNIQITTYMKHAY